MNWPALEHRSAPVDISYRELFIGYDIRKLSWQTELLDANEALLPSNRYYSRFTRIWPSRFSPGGYLLQELAKQRHGQRPSFSEVSYVPSEYSRHYLLFGLWDNLGTMLCKRVPKRGVDALVAFSVVLIEPLQEGYRQLLAQYHAETEFFDDIRMAGNNISILMLQAGKWKPKGYDVGLRDGHNPFAWRKGFGLMKRIEKNEGYTLWANRNKYGLLDDLQTAARECRIVSNYAHENGPYLIWKVYEALDPDDVLYA